MLLDHSRSQRHRRNWTEAWLTAVIRKANCDTKAPLQPRKSMQIQTRDWCWIFCGTLHEAKVASTPLAKGFYRPRNIFFATRSGREDERFARMRREGQKIRMTDFVRGDFVNRNERIDGSKIVRGKPGAEKIDLFLPAITSQIG